MLEDPISMVQLRAADSLCQFNERAGLLSILTAILAQPEPVLPLGRNRIGSPCQYLCLPEEHYHAARILGDLGKEARKARAELRNALQSGSAIVRAAAARTLARLNEPADITLPPLRQALNDPSQQSARERVEAALALFELGEPATVILPVVRELMDDPDFTASHSARALVARLTSSVAMKTVLCSP